MELRIESPQRTRVGRRTRNARQRRSVMAVLAGLWLTAVGGLPVEAAERVSLGESEWVERCFDLGAGDTLHYSFQASDPVNFDLHFHSGDTTRYPVKKGGATDGRGAYAVREPQKYCLSWANPGRSTVDVTLEARAVKK